MAGSADLAALPLMLWPPHRLAEVASEAVAQSVQWQNSVDERTNTVQFITSIQRVLKYVRKHHAVAAYEAEAVADAVHNNLIGGQWLQFVSMLEDSGRLSDKAVDKSRRMRVHPQLLQNMLNLSKDELNYVTNPKLHVLSEGTPVGITSLSSLLTLLNAPNGMTLTQICKEQSLQSGQRGTADAQSFHGAFSSHTRNPTRSATPGHCRFAPPPLDWAAPFELGALDARHALLNLNSDAESPSASLDEVSSLALKTLRHMSGTYIASLSMLQRPRPISMAPNQYDFWEDDKTGCVGSQTVVQAERAVASPLQLLPSLFEMQPTVPAASMLQAHINAQLANATCAQSQAATPVLSLSGEEAAEAQAACTSEGLSGETELFTSALALAAALPQLPSSAAASAPAELTPARSPLDFNAAYSLPAGERPKLLPRHYVSRALAAAALNTVGLQSQHFSLLDHNPPQFVLASSGLPGAHRANEGSLAKRDVAPLSTEYAEWGADIRTSGALSMPLTVHTGAVLQKWYPRDGPSASQVSESVIDDSVLDPSNPQAVPLLLPVPLAVRVLGWIMACPWVSWDVPRGSSHSQIQWVALQSTNHGVQRVALKRLFRWRNKSMQRLMPEILSQAMRRHLEFPMSPADERVGGGQQTILLVAINKALRKAVASTSEEHAFAAYAQLMQQVYAKLAPPPSSAASSGVGQSDSEDPEQVVWALKAVQTALELRFEEPWFDTAQIPRGGPEVLEAQQAADSVAHFHAKRLTWSFGHNKKQTKGSFQALSDRDISIEFEDDDSEQPAAVDMLQCMVAIGERIGRKRANTPDTVEAGNVPSSGPADLSPKAAGENLFDVSDSGSESERPFDLQLGDDFGNESNSDDSGSLSGPLSEAEHDSAEGDSDSDQSDSRKTSPRLCTDRSEWVMSYTVCALAAAFGVVWRREVLYTYNMLKPVLFQTLGLPSRALRAHEVLARVIRSGHIQGLQLLSRRALLRYKAKLVDGSRSAFKELQTFGGGAFLRITNTSSAVLDHSVKSLLATPLQALFASRQQAVRALAQCLVLSARKQQLLPPQALPWVCNDQVHGRISDSFGPGAGEALRAFMLVTPGQWLQDAHMATESTQPTAEDGQSESGQSDDSTVLDFALQAAAGDSVDGLQRMVSHICESASGCLHHDHGYPLKLSAAGVIDESMWSSAVQAFQPADTQPTRTKAGRKRRRAVAQEEPDGEEQNDDAEIARPSKQSSSGTPLILPFKVQPLPNALGTADGACDRPGTMARAAAMHCVLACQAARQAGLDLPVMHTSFKLPSNVVSRIPLLSGGTLPEIRLAQLLPTPSAQVDVAEAIGNMYIGEYLHCFGLPFVKMSMSLTGVEEDCIRVLLRHPKDLLRQHTSTLAWIVQHTDTRKVLTRLQVLGLVRQSPEPTPAADVSSKHTVSLSTVVHAATVFSEPALPLGSSIRLPLCTMGCIVRFWRDFQSLGYIVRAAAQAVQFQRLYATTAGPPVPHELLSGEASIVDCTANFNRLYGLPQKPARRQRTLRPRAQPTINQRHSMRRVSRQEEIARLGPFVDRIQPPVASKSELSALDMLRLPALEEALPAVIKRFSHAGAVPHPMQLLSEDEPMERLVPDESSLQLLCNRHIVSFAQGHSREALQQSALALLGAPRAYTFAQDQAVQQLNLLPLALKWPGSAIGSSFPSLRSLWDLLPDEDKQEFLQDPERWHMDQAQLQATDICDQSLQGRWGLSFAQFSKLMTSSFLNGNFRKDHSQLMQWAVPVVTHQAEVSEADGAMLKRVFSAPAVEVDAAFRSTEIQFSVQVDRSHLDSRLPADTQYSALFSILEPDVCIWVRSPRSMPKADAIRTAIMQGIWQWKMTRIKMPARKHKARRRQRSAGSVQAGDTGDADSQSSGEEKEASRVKSNISVLTSRIEFNSAPVLAAYTITVPGFSASHGMAQHKQVNGLDPEKLFLHYIEGLQADSMRHGVDRASKRMLPKDAQSLASFQKLQGTLPWGSTRVHHDDRAVGLKHDLAAAYAESSFQGIVSEHGVISVESITKVMSLTARGRKLWGVAELCCLLNPYVNWQLVADACGTTLDESVGILFSADVLATLSDALRAECDHTELSETHRQAAVANAEAQAESVNAPPLPWKEFFGLEKPPADDAASPAPIFGVVKWDPAAVEPAADPAVASSDNGRVPSLSHMLGVEIQALHVRLQQLAAMGFSPPARQSLAFLGRARLGALVAAGDFPVPAALCIGGNNGGTDLASRETFASSAASLEDLQSIAGSQQRMLESTVQGGFFPVDAHRTLMQATVPPHHIATTEKDSEPLVEDLKNRWNLQVSYEPWRQALFGTRDALRSNAMDTALAALDINLATESAGGGAYSGLHEVSEPGSCGSLVIKHQVAALSSVSATLEAWQQATLARAILISDGPLVFCPHCAALGGRGKGFVSCDCATGALILHCPKIQRASSISFTSADEHTASAIALVASAAAQDLVYAQNTSNHHLQLAEGFSREAAREMCRALSNGLSVSNSASVGTMTYSTAKARVLALSKALVSVLETVLSEVPVLDDGHIDAVLRDITAATTTSSIKAALPRVDKMLQQLDTDLRDTLVNPDEALMAALPGRSNKPSSGLSVWAFLRGALHKVQSQITMVLQAPPDLEAGAPVEERGPAGNDSPSAAASIHPGTRGLKQELLGNRAQLLAASDGMYSWKKPGTSDDLRGDVLSLPVQHGAVSGKRQRPGSSSDEPTEKGAWDTPFLVSSLWGARAEFEAGEDAQSDKGRVCRALLHAVCDKITGDGMDSSAAPSQMLPLSSSSSSPPTAVSDLNLHDAIQVVTAKVKQLAEVGGGLLEFAVELGLVTVAKQANGVEQTETDLEAAQLVTIASLCVLSQPSSTAALDAAVEMGSGDFVRCAAAALSPMEVVWPAPPASAAAPVAAVLAWDCIRWVAQPRAWLYACSPVGAARLEIAAAAAAAPVSDGGGTGFSLPHEMRYPGAARCCVVALDLPHPRPVWPWITPDGMVEHAARRTWERAIVSAVMLGTALNGKQLSARMPQLPPSALLWHLHHLQLAGCVTIAPASRPPSGSARHEAPHICMTEEFLHTLVVTATKSAAARYIRHEFAPELLRSVARLAPVRWRKQSSASAF